MAVCLDYQTIYYHRTTRSFAVRWQLVLAVALLATLGAKVWLKLQVTDVGYEVARAQQATVELEMRRRELQLEMAVLTRRDTLFAEAQRRIGLTYLAPNQARIIK